jgi:hypothetical protein
VACTRLGPLAAAEPKGDRAVLICRCAWHPHYRGYPLLNGVASWRGWNVRFTDGICEECLKRFRAEHRKYFEKRPADPSATASTAPAA